LFGRVIDELVASLRCLPGVGPKSAQRMALHLLERDRDAAYRLSASLELAAKEIGRCKLCRTLTETEICVICSNPRRQSNQLCVIETPSDMLAIEQSGTYQGRYFVLLGHLSPIDGIGPEEIGIDQLIERLLEDNIQELILATNLTIEGEATAHYISERAKDKEVIVSRIAHGVPMGGELEYVDGSTLSHAFSSRKKI
jgi:recombination protein RecR|tara:strand:- start:423 stop:1016 length:594 start_codon:yes stop_codon:yes gene_type:complete